MDTGCGHYGLSDVRGVLGNAAVKRSFRLVHKEARTRALLAVHEAPDGFVVEVKPPTRNLEQNALMWSLLTEVSEQVDWYGKKLTPDEWKDVFTASLKRAQVVPGLDGGFVVLGQRTSTMTKREFSDLVELINAFACEKGVVFSDKRMAA